MEELRPSVVVNPRARRGGEWTPLVRAAIGARAAVFLETSSPDELEQFLRAEMERGQKEIWVGGGDGTIRRAAEILAETDVVLGVLPLGTGNSLAQELGVPVHPEEMVRGLFERSEVVAIDVGRFNGSVFVNLASLGVSSKIAQALDGVDKSKSGRMAYLPALMRAVWLSRPIKVWVTESGKHWRTSLLQFVAASGRLHGGPFAVTTDSSLTDGRLSCYLVRSADRTTLWRYGWALLRGRHTHLPEVWTIETEGLELALQKERTFVLDGDLVRTRTARIQIVPGGLTVRVVR